MIHEIVLDQPRRKNALNTETLQNIQNELINALKDESIKLVVIRHTGDDFCAGGDVKSLYHAIKKEDYTTCQDFFTTEYSTDYFIHIYPKPILVLARGLQFGGGMGLAMGAKYRIACPSSWFSMPEVLIGLFPDVGASYFLKNIAWQERLDFVQKAQRISAEVAKKWNFCDAVIEELDEFLEELKNKLNSGEDVDVSIKDLINKYSVSKYGEQVLDSPLNPCPTSQDFSKKQLKIGEDLSLKEAFIKEWSYAMRFCDNPNFKEGVRALLVDKDKKPKWHDDIDINQLFQPVDDKSFQDKLEDLEKLVAKYA